MGGGFGPVFFYEAGYTASDRSQHDAKDLINNRNIEEERGLKTGGKRWGVERCVLGVLG